MMTIVHKGKEYEIAFGYQFDTTLFVEIVGWTGFDLDITELGNVEKHIIEKLGE